MIIALRIVHAVQLYFTCTTAGAAVEQVWSCIKAYSGNAFANAKLTAKFSNKDTTYGVDGFYDRGNTFKIRFMPEKTGIWNYV